MAEPPETQDAAIKEKWREIFNEPELNALEKQLDIDNQNIALYFQNFMAARAQVGETRFAFFPTVTANPSYSRSGAAGSAGTANGATGSGSTGGAGTAASTTPVGSSAPREAATTASLRRYDTGLDPYLDEISAQLTLLNNQRAQVADRRSGPPDRGHAICKRRSSSWPFSRPSCSGLSCGAAVTKSSAPYPPPSRNSRFPAPSYTRSG